MAKNIYIYEKSNFQTTKKKNFNNNFIQYEKEYESSSFVEDDNNNNVDYMCIYIYISLLEWIVKPSGCHRTDAFGGEKYIVD